MTEKVALLREHLVLDEERVIRNLKKEIEDMKTIAERDLETNTISLVDDTWYVATAKKIARLVEERNSIQKRIELYDEMQYRITFGTTKYKVFQALTISRSSTVPGAIHGDSYVYFDDEHNQYCYVPDIKSKNPETWRMDYDQVLRLVIGADEHVWTPVGNFQF